MSFALIKDSFLYSTNFLIFLMKYVWNFYLWFELFSVFSTKQEASIIFIYIIDDISFFKSLA